MKKTRLIASLIIILVLLTSCAKTEEPLLSVANKEYTRSELKDLGTISVDYTNKDGEVTTYEGVLLATLLQNADLTENGATVTFTAADGYEAEAAMEELLDCTNCIVAFDDESLRLVMPDFSGKLQVKDLAKICVQ